MKDLKNKKIILSKLGNVINTKYF